MERQPRISIVTPYFNQAKHIIAAIESVMAQDYPDVEHIVIDGSSTDGTLDSLWPYPHLKLVCEPDRGYAGAINKGLGLATGQICGILDADDTLLPGALCRVAREIDPACGRHIVLGRCRFLDERGRYTGIEHPSGFESHWRVLEVWEGHTIPRPAVFWKPEVWQTCGLVDNGLDMTLIDYDLFCKFSRRYRFHFVDQVLATSRVHMESRSERWTEADRLEDRIGISRRYWGSPLSPMYWRLALSLALFRLNRRGRARRYLRHTEESWRQGQVLPALTHALSGAILAPEVAFYVGVYPSFRDRAARVWKKMLHRLGEMGGPAPETAPYLEHTDVWSDGWVGPRLVVRRETGRDPRAVRLKGWTDLRHIGRSLVLTVRVDQRVIGQHRVRQSGDFAARIPLPGHLAPGSHTVGVEASAWFVPHRSTLGGDFRPLAWRFGGIDFETVQLEP